MSNRDDAGDYAGLEESVRRGQAAQKAVDAEIAKVMREPRGHPGCRYYGHSNVALRAIRELVSSGGNECALIHTSYAPCEMTMAGMQPDQALCPRAIARLASGEKP